MRMNASIVACAFMTILRAANAADLVQGAAACLRSTAGPEFRRFEM
jgi:hypothetical protein